MNFGKGSTVLEAPNGSGKSAVMKSLYEALGAQPHKIVPQWREANVVSLLEFSVDTRTFYALRAYGTFGIFDSDQNLLIRTQAITSELGPFLARLMNFRLVMKNKKDQTLTPPPSYIFAPFYMDQDRSWSKVWDSFSDLFLPRSANTLAEYHSGTKGNAYYEAQAKIDDLRKIDQDISATKRALEDAILQIEEISPDVGVQFDIELFAAERDRLLIDSNALMEEQRLYRIEFSDLSEERHIWNEQAELISASLSEMSDDLAIATVLPVDVECPTCGHHHSNSIAAQFQIVEHKDSLLFSLSTAREKLKSLDQRISTLRDHISHLQASARRVAATLDISRNDIRFEDVVAAAGRNEALRVLRSKLGSTDLSLADIQRQIAGQEVVRRSATDRRRALAIREFFNQKMAAFSAKLDVQIEDRRRVALHSSGRARGSEGARELVAYYYAFLHTAREFSSSIYCPVVVDAPNQQGQDAQHLPRVLQFLIEERPAEAQLIVAVEDAEPIRNNPDVEIIKVGVSSRQVLDPAQYDSVRAAVGPFIDQLLQA